MDYTEEIIDYILKIGVDDRDCGCARKVRRIS